MIVSTRLTITWLIVCLGVHCGLLAWGALRHSPTFDELSYLPAGVCHLETGRFELNRVSPPLVRTIAAIPVYVLRPVTDWSGLADRPGPEADRQFAERFLRANPKRLFWFFTIARWACIPFSLLGGVICYVWAKQLYGATSGLLAVTLWCFCPNILAHAQLITADAAASALGVTAAYCFWRWLKQPSWEAAVLSGCVLGLAELTKSTWIVLLAMWPLLLIGRRWRAKHNAGAGARNDFAQLATILSLAVLVINFGYLFNGSFQPLGKFHFISRSLAGDSAKMSSDGGNRFAATWLGSIPVPLPKDYLKGIDIQKRDFEQNMWSYLGGEWRRGGWWYYYLYGLAIKVPLGTWGLAAMAIVAALFATGYSAHKIDEWMLLAPLLVVLALASSQTGLNHHLRYVLPIFPFAFISISRVARCVDLRHRRCCVIAATLLSWSVASSVMIYPHSLAYFNEVVGGPTRGHEYLLSSNLDWCQDLLFLKRWVDRHPGSRPIMLSYRFPDLARAAKIDFELPPVERGSAVDGAGSLWPAGWYAVSVSYLHDRGGQYGRLSCVQPVDRAGYSICIYHLGPGF